MGTDVGARSRCIPARRGEIVPFDQDQLIGARNAFRKFGKGRYAAGLNFGDCAAYTLAQWPGEALLFKGGISARRMWRRSSIETTLLRALAADLS